MIRPLLAAGLASVFATAALSADLGQRKPEPPAPVSVSCKETSSSGVSSDAFGFSTGTDVSDVGAYALQFEYNGAFSGAGFKPGTFSSHLGKVQLSTAFIPCWEVGPYVLGSKAVGTNRFVFGDVTATQFGAGVENKYKLLGRGVHGFGLTFVTDQNYQGFNVENSQVLPRLNWSGGQFNSTYKLLLDKELVSGKLWSLLNVQYDQIWTERPALVNPVAGTSDWVRNSVLTLSAALSYQILDGLFLGAETRYVRTHNGILFKTFTGDALYVGPTMFWQAAKNVTVSGTYGIQVAGKAAFANPATVAPNLLSSDLNLVTQSQHIAKLKLAISF